ncbi:hypothetical protein PENDEC_c027G03858 [Penicillium decumbens]|uniref:Uncharacterized protein n=1 Tax=Penicillium decumbens TaxID=69771 RepID=A0A1V6NZG4_PENDC|nr:hypothetical protein PENDEC_c027G03858 [Penicillium decumbens]
MSLQPPDGDIFTAEEIQCLEEDAIFLPQPQASRGKRKVSASLVSPPSSISTPSSTSSASASVRTQPSTISTYIPTEEDSPEVLEYLGFQTFTARQIFERYANRPDPDNCPDDLLDYAYGQIGVLQTPRYCDMDIQEAMAQVGLTRQIQSAIADPAFSDMLWTRDLHFWVKDTIQTNYATLRYHQELLKRHARRRIADKHKRGKRRKRTSVHDIFPPEGGPEVAEASEADVPGPDITATINMTIQDFNLPSTHVALLEGGPPALPNHILLYKGKAHQELRETKRLIRADGSIDISTLSTSPGSDFNWSFNAQYWTPEKDTAERYRQWAARRSPDSDTCIICIQVSNDFLERIVSADIWYSPDWKEFVWTCRDQRLLPPKFSYLSDTELIKGHICTGLSRKIKRIPAANVQTQITRDKLLHCTSTNRPAIQWMFWKDNTVNRLGDEC